MNAPQIHTADRYAPADVVVGQRGEAMKLFAKRKYSLSVNYDRTYHSCIITRVSPVSVRGHDIDFWEIDSIRSVTRTTRKISSGGAIIEFIPEELSGSITVRVPGVLNTLEVTLASVWDLSWS